MIIGNIVKNKNVINQFNKMINIFDKQKIIYYLICIFKDIHFTSMKCLIAPYMESLFTAQWADIVAPNVGLSILSYG